MYPIDLEIDDNGTWLVTCPDLPEVTSWGEDREDAIHRAGGAVEEALAARIAHREEIPPPSDAAGRPLALLPPLTEAKVSLYRAAHSAGISRAELGRRLGWQALQVDRLFNLRSRSKIEQIDQALRLLGKRLVVSVRDAA